MPILSDQDKKALEAKFKAELKDEVLLRLFTVRAAGLLVLPGRDCPTCPQANELLTELASLSPKIKVEAYDFYMKPQEAQAAAVDRVPCIVISRSKDKANNIKFYGIPSGYEFITLLEAIMALSKGLNPLKPLTRKALRMLDKDVRIQVFVTPTCTFCPQIARLVHAMAMETEHIKADVIEVQEFPHLAQAFRVQSVPKTVINGLTEIVGAVPEETFIQRLLTAIGREDLLEIARVPGDTGPVNAPSSLVGREPQQQGAPGGRKLV